MKKKLFVGVIAILLAVFAIVQIPAFSSDNNESLCHCAKYCKEDPELCEKSVLIKVSPQAAVIHKAHGDQMVGKLGSCVNPICPATKE